MSYLAKFTFWLLVLGSSNLARASVYFGSQDHVFNDELSQVYEDINQVDGGNFSVDTAEDKLLRAIENNAQAGIDLSLVRKIGGLNGYRVVEQRPLTLVARVSLSRALTFKRFEVHLQTRFEAKTIVFSVHASSASPKKLLSFGVEVVDENGHIFMKQDGLSADELNIDRQKLDIRAPAWLADLIRQKFRDANRLSVREQLYVRLRLRGMHAEELWELNKEELLDFLSLKSIDRWFFRCNKSLRGNRRSTAPEILGE